MRVRAFAKINLSLRVLGMRPDGYHELRTVFQSLALHDTLTFERSREALSLTCDDPACPVDGRNLVWRAAVQVWRAAGKRRGPRGVRIHLVKRIPMQAGLGGGSSDAAAAIRALGRWWGVNEARQREIGARLGADVPYFFEGGTVLGLDRGDLLFPLLDGPPSWVAVAVPPFGVSTAEAFRWLDADSIRRPRTGRPTRASCLNDFEPAVAARHPEVAALVRRLRRDGASVAAMSGSGSAVFGLFARRADALRAAQNLPRRLAGRVIVSRTIDRDAYRRLACK